MESLQQNMVRNIYINKFSQLHAPFREEKWLSSKTDQPYHHVWADVAIKNFSYKCYYVASKPLIYFFYSSRNVIGPRVPSFSSEAKKVSLESGITVIEITCEYNNNNAIVKLASNSY